MGRVIKMLAATKGLSVFIVGYGTMSNILSYRYSDEPGNVINEVVKRKGDKIYTKNFSIPLEALREFIKSNENP